MHFQRLLVLMWIVILWGCRQPSSAQLPYTDPDNNGSWTLLENLSDEFEGTTLDNNKWIIQGENNAYQNNFIGRAPAQFSPSNISVADGHLTITAKWEPDFNFNSGSMNGYNYGSPAPITTGAIITKNTFYHGYMEIRCKAAAGPISSAFWTTGQEGELDVFEHYGENPNNPYSGKRYHTSFHDWRNPQSDTWGKRIWTNEHILDFRVADDFHIYGLEWAEDYIKIYVDGRLIRFTTKEEIGEAWVLNYAQKVWLDVEAFPWEVNPASLQASDFSNGGRKYMVDYVRIWQRTVEENLDTRENLLTNAGFESSLNNWDTQGNVTVETEDVAEGSKAVKLNNLASVEQEVTVKPNTTYVFSASVKLPGTNMQNIWHNALIGAKEFGGETNEVRYFRPEFRQQSVQFTTGRRTTTATVYLKNVQATHTTIADNFTLEEAIDLSGNTVTVIEDASDLVTLSFYPNPVQNNLIVESKEKALLKLCDIDGKIMLEKVLSVGENRVEVTQLPRGIYCIFIETTQQFFKRKLIVN